MNANLFDILPYAVIAGFLALKLISVLGRHTGHTPKESSGEDNVIVLPDKGRGDRGSAGGVADFPDSQPGSIQQGVAAICREEPDFELDHFLDGVRIAFQMVMTAFATGDRGALRSLLDDKVFDAYSRAIAEREEAGETLESTIDEISTVKPISVALNGKQAVIAVQIVSAQTNVLRDAEGGVIEGKITENEGESGAAMETIIDVWTFARYVHSDDSNWLLISSHLPSADTVSA